MSNDTRHLHVEWRIEEGECSFSWSETGGPAVQKPRRSGFGTRLINMVGSSLSGEALIDYKPQGVASEVKAAVGKLQFENEIKPIG